MLNFGSIFYSSLDYSEVAKWERERKEAGHAGIGPWSRKLQLSLSLKESLIECLKALHRFICGYYLVLLLLWLVLNNFQTNYCNSFNKIITIDAVRMSIIRAKDRQIQGRKLISCYFAKSMTFWRMCNNHILLG